jgi:hypothetical protein
MAGTSHATTADVPKESDKSKPEDGPVVHAKDHSSNNGDELMIDHVDQ